jgi:hypothetical protein
LDIPEPRINSRSGRLGSCPDAISFLTSSFFS